MNRFYRLIATLIPRRLYGIPAPAPAAHQLTSTLIPTTLYTRVDLNRPLAADHLTSTLIPRRLYGILAPAAAAAHQLTSTGNSEVRDFSTRPRKSKERSLRYKSHRGQFPCYSCTLIFHYEPPLREHYNNIHPEVVKLGFGCSCGAFFLDMFELRKHITLGQCPYDGKNETRKLKDFRLVEKWRKRQATEEKEEERKSLLGYEGLEVINPEGGIEDAEVEAEKGRWRQEDRDTFWKMMQNCIGYDVTSMATLPVLIFEPMTMLQKMAELMEYSYLLELADECEDRHMGLVYAAAWFVSLYYAIQRTWKPFNPVLGETYEMVNHNGITFIAEQVSHHPPMSAAHAENEHFIYDVTSKLKTKFLGNSVDIYPVGRTRLTLKNSGVVLDLVPPPSKAYNIIFGRTWVDSPGDMVLTNLTTGDKVVLNFQPCGWFGAGRYEVDGFVYNAEEEPTFFMAGKWNEFMSYQPCDSEGEPLAGCELKEVWRVADAPKNDKFQYTHFAHKLNSFDTAPKMLLPSDSRLRPDRLALEHGDLSKAGAEKSRLQDRQRLERRTRKARHHEFKPKWFDLTTETASTPWGDLEIYQYNGEYAKHRAAIDNLDKAEETETNPTEFNPWRQYQDLPASQS